MEHYLILNRPSGSFVGGIKLSSKVLEALLKHYGYGLEELEEKVQRIFNEYKKTAPKNIKQIKR